MSYAEITKSLSELEIRELERKKNISYLDLKKLLLVTIRTGKCGLKFIDACTSKDKMIKRVGYLGASFVNDDLKIMMTNTLRKEINSGNKDLAYAYIANTDYNYEIEIKENGKKALICAYKLLGTISDINLVGYDETLFFIKLQILLDYILQNRNQQDQNKNLNDSDKLCTFKRHCKEISHCKGRDYYKERSSLKEKSHCKERSSLKEKSHCKERSHLKERSHCDKNYMLSGIKTDELSDRKLLSINEMQKDFLCSLYRQIKDKYIKLKLVQVYKLIGKNPPLEQDISNSIYIASNIDIALSTEICGLINTSRSQEFILKLLKSQGNLLISGMRLAYQNKQLYKTVISSIDVKYSPELKDLNDRKDINDSNDTKELFGIAIDRALREIAISKYPARESKKREMIKNILGIQSKESLVKESSEEISGFKPSRNPIKIEYLDDFQKSVINLLDKNNYKIVLSSRDPTNHKWLPILVKIFHCTRKLRILQENPILAYYTPLKKLIPPEKQHKIVNWALNKLTESDNQQNQIIENLFYNKVWLIEMILQLYDQKNDNSIDTEKLNDFLMILYKEKIPSYFKKAKLNYHTLYRFCNFLLSNGDLEANRKIIESAIYKTFENQVFTKTLLDVHEVFNIVLPIKSIWIPYKCHCTPARKNQGIRGHFFYYKISDFVEFFSRPSINQPYFKDKNGYFTEKNDKIIVENSVLLVVDKVHSL